MRLDNDESLDDERIRFPIRFHVGILVCGASSRLIVIVDAIILQVRPAEHILRAILVLIFSTVSLVGICGFMIGALLGIAGGALALGLRVHSI
jgi:hypothetical protein